MFTGFIEFEYVLPIAAVIAFLVCVIILPMLIPFLRKLKFGQTIHEDVKWHAKKAGTPPMGGIAFIIAIVAAMLSCVVSPAAMLVTFTAVGFGVIGFIDDYIKVVLKRNAGLSAKQKFLLQVVVSVAFIVIGRLLDVVKTDICIPFMEKTVDIGIFIYPFAVFIMAGFSNAANLTDGIDGLATSVTAVVAVTLGVISTIAGKLDMAVLCAALFGACIGFLIFNFHPAKVFMGDTGSCFFGGLVAAIALVLKMPILLVVIGIVYVIETASVILQTAYFKYTKKKYGEGKRLFRMSPIHHHFEKGGWSEVKIVSVAVIVSVIGGVAAVLMQSAYLF